MEQPPPAASEKEDGQASQPHNNQYSSPGWIDGTASNIPVSVVLHSMAWEIDLGRKESRPGHQDLDDLIAATS